MGFGFWVVCSWEGDREEIWLLEDRISEDGDGDWDRDGDDREYLVMRDWVIIDKYLGKFGLHLTAS